MLSIITLCCFIRNNAKKKKRKMEEGGGHLFHFNEGDVKLGTGGGGKDGK